MDSIFKFLIGIMPSNFKPLIVPIVVTFPLLYSFLFITIEAFPDYSVFDRIMIAVSGSIIEVFACFIPYALTTIAGKWKYENYRPVRFETYCLFAIIFPFIGCALIYVNDIQRGVGWSVAGAINLLGVLFVFVCVIISLASFKFSLERSKNEGCNNDDTNKNDVGRKN